MLKILIGVVAVFVCMAIGAAYSGIYKKRVDFYSAILSFNSELKRNLVFRRENVAEILQSKKEYAMLCVFYPSAEKKLLQRIKYFVTVAECNSFTEAAEQCYISQSAISQ